MSLILLPPAAATALWSRLDLVNKELCKGPLSVILLSLPHCPKMTVLQLYTFYPFDASVVALLNTTAANLAGCQG